MIYKEGECDGSTFVIFRIPWEGVRQVVGNCCVLEHHGVAFRDARYRADPRKEDSSNLFARSH